MDSENLISLIQENESLWNRKSKNYHNRELNKRKWKEVAAKMNSTEDAVRQKWRGLRDTFRKEMLKSLTRSGDGAHSTSKWPFFSNMTFVQDQFIPRQTKGNIDSTDTTSQPEAELQSQPFPEEDLSYHVQTIIDEQSTLVDNDTTTNHLQNQRLSTKRRKTTENLFHKSMVVEEEKLDFFRRISDIQDDDHHFALSLVPYLRQLPTHRKMLVRAKFQQILADEHSQLMNENIPKNNAEI